MPDRKELIDRIVNFKLPGALRILSGRRLEGNDAQSAYDSIQYHVDQEKAILESMSERELQDLYSKEETRVFQENLESEARIKSIEFPFLSANANANLSLWSTVKLWSLEQATALLLGKDPSMVSFEKMDGLIENLYFVRQYKLLWADLETSGLKFPVAPETVLKWAENNERDFPKILATLVYAQSTRCDDDYELMRNVDSQRTPNPTTSRVERKMIRGGAKIIGAKAILREIYGASKPTGVKKKTAFSKVTDTLKERGMDAISEATFDRAWNELYNQTESASAEGG